MRPAGPLLSRATHHDSPKVSSTSPRHACAGCVAQLTQSPPTLASANLITGHWTYLGNLGVTAVTRPGRALFRGLKSGVSVRSGVFRFHSALARSLIGKASLGWIDAPPEAPGAPRIHVRSSLEFFSRSFGRTDPTGTSTTKPASILVRFV